MRNFVSKIRSYWGNKRHYDKFLIVTSLIYLGVIGFFLILHRAPYSPDQFYLFALVFAVLIGQGREFIKDWTPPILLILAYEYLRGFIEKVNPVVHYQLMIRFDTFVFGQLPTVALQHWLFDPNHLHWYDYLSGFLYEIHYVVFLFIAFILWMGDREDFEAYIFGAVGISYMAFFTYVAFPAAPPWLAAQYGLIPPVTHITNIVFSHFFPFIALPTVYAYVGADLTAAVPSLHAALPFFTALFIGKKYPQWIPLLTVYIIGIGFAVIYLGEHYFFDVALGMLYAYIAYRIVMRWHNRKSRVSEVRQ